MFPQNRVNGKGRGESAKKPPRWYLVLLCVAGAIQAGLTRIFTEDLTVVFGQKKGRGPVNVRTEQHRAILRGCGATKIVDRALDIPTALLPATNAGQKLGGAVYRIKLGSWRRDRAANAWVYPVMARRIGSYCWDVRFESHTIIVS